MLQLISAIYFFSTQLAFTFLHNSPSGNQVHHSLSACKLMLRLFQSCNMETYLKGFFFFFLKKNFWISLPSVAQYKLHTHTSHGFGENKFNLAFSCSLLCEQVCVMKKYTRHCSQTIILFICSKYHMFMCCLITSDLKCFCTPSQQYVA